MEKVEMIEDAHDGCIWCVQTNPKDPSVFASSGTDKCTKIWKISGVEHECTLIATVQGLHTRTIRSLAWSPNGQMLAQASFDGTATVLRFEPGFAAHSLVSRLEGHENEVKCVAWSPNTQWLATCGRDKTVWIWSYSEDDDDFECYAIKQEHTQDVKCLCWHPTNSSLFLSGSYDGTVRVWSHDSDLDEWECIQMINAFVPLSKDRLEGTLPDTVWNLAFVPRPRCQQDSLNRFICTGDNGRLQEYSFDERMQRWELRAEPRERYSHGPIYGVSWNPKDPNLLAIGAADGFVALLHRQANDELNEWLLQSKTHAPLNSDINSVCWSCDGNLLVYGTDSGLLAVVGSLPSSVQQAEC